VAGVSKPKVLSMSLHFHQTVQTMDIWSANSAGISFVISFASPNGAGLRGRHGFLASWRPLYSGSCAVKVTGSPFSTFVEAEAACNTMLSVLNEVRKPNRVLGNRWSATVGYYKLKESSPAFVWTHYFHLDDGCSNTQRKGPRKFLGSFWLCGPKTSRAGCVHRRRRKCRRASFCGASLEGKKRASIRWFLLRCLRLRRESPEQSGRTALG